MGHILIVDDDWMNRELLEAYLTMGGYTVKLANSGETALEMIEAEQPDLIMLDIRMTGISGFEVCMQIKSSEHTKTIPVLMVSALESEGDRMQASQMGADGFVAKPFNSASILEQIKTHLG
ncbi:MAG: response regulator [Anaerolineae bacterium]|nr:response regulator [Anaerolineae bacterium]